MWFVSRFSLVVFLSYIIMTKAERDTPSQIKYRQIVLNTTYSTDRVFETFWRPQIAIENDTILNKISHMYKSMNDLLLSNQNQVDQQLPPTDELQVQLRDTIIEEYGKRLAHTLSSRHSDVAFFQKLIQSIYSCDSKVLVKICENVIDKLYGLKSANSLADALQLIASDGTPESYAVVLEAELYLFWKFKSRNDFNDVYLLNIGYYWHQYRTKPKYPISALAIRSLDKGIETLPSVVKHLFWTENKCLMSYSTQEYLYDTLTNEPLMDAKRRYVCTWFTKQSVRNSVMFITPEATYNENGDMVLSHKLFNVLNREYIFRDNANDNKMMAWIPAGEVPINSRWTVSMNDKGILFKQDEYYMCSTNEYYEQGLRR